MLPRAQSVGFHVNNAAGDDATQTSFEISEVPADVMNARVAHDELSALHFRVGPAEIVEMIAKLANGTNGDRRKNLFGLQRSTRVARGRNHLP